MTRKNNSRKYIIGLLITWLLGCILQYFLCCKEKVTEVAAVVVPAVASASIGTDKAAEVQTESVPEATMNTFKVSGDKIGVEFGSEDNFNFLADTENPVLPASEGLQNNTKQLVEYLGANAGEKLTITGLYRSTEKNTSNFDNLGLARANQVKEYLVSQGANAEQIDLAGQVDDLAVSDADGKYLGRANFSLAKMPQVESAMVEPLATMNAFNVSGDEAGVDFGSEDNFNFLADSEMIVTPMSEGLKHNAKQLVDYLANNTGDRLTVTGLYRADETNTSIFPNLGLARANQVKSYLVSQGVNARQINLASKLDEKATADKDGKYFGRADFSLVKVDETLQQKYDEDMKLLLADIQANPVTIYFATGDSSVKLTEKQRSTIFDMIRYLDYDVNAQVNVTGHTDNVGNEAANIKLGKERAVDVANYLSSKGLNKSRINVRSKGPNQPIADNTTAEGRAKNRRVTIGMTNEKIN